MQSTFIHRSSREVDQVKSTRAEFSIKRSILYSAVTLAYVTQRLYTMLQKILNCRMQSPFEYVEKEKSQMTS